MVQCLGQHAFIAVLMGSVPSQGTRIPNTMSHAPCQKKKKDWKGRKSIMGMQKLQVYIAIQCNFGD